VRHTIFAAGIGEDVNVVAEVEQAGNLPEDECLRGDGKGAHEDANAQGAIHGPVRSWNTSA
jgi:hypothetical protein